MALKGMWGSFFSRRWGRALQRPRGIWSHISLVIGPPVAAEKTSATDLQNRVCKLGNFPPPEAARKVV